MSYEFKKLSDAEAVATVSDSASVLIEENGVIKRAPKGEVGGVKVASTAKVGQTIVVKAVDADGKPTEWECADKGGQADWNENDETSMAYVRNRPFYDKTEIITLYEEQTVSCITDGNYAYGNYEPLNMEELQWKTLVVIVFDGVEYENIFWNSNGENDWIDFRLSDGNAVGIYTFGGRYGNDTWNNVVVPSSLAGEHTIKIVQKMSRPKQLDSKFIPFPIKNGTGEYCLMFSEALEASGYCSHAEGYQTTASGANSHAEGNSTTASDSDSHAEGYSTTASGGSSHAEGGLTVASGYCSHAEGERTTASGFISHAEGASTTAQRRSQHVQGEYNILDTEGSTYDRGKYAHIIGNGTSDTERSNAHTVDWSGNAWYQGTIEGTAMIVKSSTSGSTKRFKITVDDSGTIKATQISG